MSDAPDLRREVPGAAGAALGPLAVRLIERFQDGVPLVPAPFAAMADTLGVDEQAVLGALRDLRAAGVLTRVGPVFAPLTLGASTLAALAVPPAELERVAALVSGYDEVNHNYERDHVLNLWFVITAADRRRVDTVLGAIAERTGLEPLDLPLLEPYHIDLGFPPWGGDRAPRERRATGEPASLDDLDRRVAAAVENGLVLEPRPFAGAAARAGCEVGCALERLDRLRALGVVKRFGLVVRHHELGFRANAMVVMDVADARVGAVGRRLAEEDTVTLCYRRPRRLPRWRYNLFCMIHGRERSAVRAEARRLRDLVGIDEASCDVLFSTRRFKQRGARYAPAAEGRPCAA